MSNPIFAIIEKKFRILASTKEIFFNLFSSPLIVLILIVLNINGVIKLPFAARYTDFIIPGLICLQVVSRASLFGSILVFDNRGHIKLLKVSPLSRASLVIGLLLAEILVQLAGVALLLLLFFIHVKLVSLLNFILIIILIILISITFSGLFAILAFLIRQSELFKKITTFIYFGIYLLSGIFYPITNLPIFLKYLVYINPMTYAVDALRYLFIGIHEINLFISVGVLVIFSITTILLSTFLFVKMKKINY